MIRQLYPESISGPAEYDYTDPVECHVCYEEFDAEAHAHLIFELIGVPPNYGGYLCGGCDITCAWCEHTVLELLPCRIKEAADGVAWIDGEPYHGDCVAVALCQEAA